jgi:hypothetical protein
MVCPVSVAEFLRAKVSLRARLLSPNLPDAMPVNGPLTLISTINEFVSHWEVLDHLIAPRSPLIMLKVVLCAGLVALRKKAAPSVA